MAVLIDVTTHGITSEQYDQVLKLLKWETNPPKGAIFYCGSFSDGALKIMSVWESEQDFQLYRNDLLAPVQKQLGISSRLEVKTYPVRIMFSPAFTLRPELMRADWSQYVGGIS